MQKSRMLLMLALSAALAACQLGLPGKGGSDAAPELATDGVMGPEVTVSTLPAPGEAPAAAPDAKPKAAPDKPDGKTDAKTPPAEDEKAKEAEAPAPVIKSPEQLACEKKGGQYVQFGRSSVRTCQRPTRDGGKSCRRAQDCEGSCLARSATCAPVTPTFGCQDVLQNDGRRVKLCIE